MYLLSIIIINYKTPQLTMAVLESLEGEIDPLNMQVVLIENGSQDNSKEILTQWIEDHQADSWIRLIHIDKNKGFSGGNNTGINEVEATYYLLLNSDTIIRKGAISSLLKTARLNSDAGLISPRLESKDGTPQESCFRFHSPISELLYSAKTSFLTNIFAKYVIAYPVKHIADHYQWTSFACVLIKAEVIDQIGFLDEGFFMYFEDVEFSHRAFKAGWHILNQPEARVAHLRGGSSPLKSLINQRKRLPLYFYESRTRYFYMIYGRSGLLAANLFWSAGAVIAFSRRLVSKKYQSNVAEKQWLDIWINFLNPLKPYTHPDNYV